MLSTSNLQSSSPGFESRSGHLLDFCSVIIFGQACNSKLIIIETQVNEVSTKDKILLLNYNIHSSDYIYHKRNKLL